MFVAALFSGLQHSYAFAKIKGVWTLNIEHAECLKNNLQSYQETNHKIVIIDLNKCPETDPLANPLAKIQNSARLAPGVKTVRNADGLDEVLVMSRKQLLCLSDSSFMQQGDVVILSKVTSC